MVGCTDENMVGITGVYDLRSCNSWWVPAFQLHAFVRWCVLLCSFLCSSAVTDLATPADVCNTVHRMFDALSTRITCSQYRAMCGAVPAGSVRLATGNQSWIGDAAE